MIMTSIVARVPRKGTMGKRGREKLYPCVHVCVCACIGCQGFIQWGGLGGSLALKTPSFPPKKKERKKKRGKERERERERGREGEVHGGGRGACIFLCRITQLFKSTR